MINRRVVAVDIIKLLLLTTLLLCAASAMSGKHVNNIQDKNLSPEGALASAISPAAQISGDGLIAFSADEQIYIMNADGSAVTRFTDNSPNVLYRYPALSPDGTRLAFTRDEGTDHALYVVGIDGNNLRRLSTSSVGVAEPVWSPDGSKIAYLRGYDTTYGGLANLSGCGPEIYVIDVFSARETNLTQGAGGVDPTWSPDGTRIAFSSARNGNYEIYMMPVDGSELKQLTTTEWAEAEPAWSPDGKRIAYTSNLRRGTFACGFMSTGRPLDGLSEERTSIFIMTDEGTNHTKLAMSSGGMEPAWSPDGSRLALVINSKGGFQIYVINANGTNLTRLTSDSTQKLSPSWSCGSIGL